MAAQGFALVQLSIAFASFKIKKFSHLDRFSLVFTILNVLIQTGSFVWCHVARWSHSGRVCSGDYLSADQRSNFNEDRFDNTYLIKEGLFLKWWVVANWVSFGLMFCCLSTCIMFLRKLKPNFHIGAHLVE